MATTTCLWCDASVSYFELRDNGNYEYYRCSGPCGVNAISVEAKRHLLDLSTDRRLFAAKAAEAHKAGQVLWVRLDDQYPKKIDVQTVSVAEAEKRLRR